MIGDIIGLAIAIGAILLGIKGFTAAGLPFTNAKRLTGTTAKVVGVICILLGLAMLAGLAYPYMIQSR